MIELERDAPDLEDLAAYLDGRLSAERKAQVEERLLLDEDYYDVFRETMEFQQEAGQEDEAGSNGDVVAPAVWWRSWKVIAPAIAATVLMAFAIQHLILGPSIDHLLAQLNARALIESGSDWDAPGWWVSRGASDPAPTFGTPEEVAFRLGTRTVDLKIALAAEDRDAAKGPVRRLTLLTDAEAIFLQPLPFQYEELLGKLDDEDLTALETQATQLEKSLGGYLQGVETDRYALGAWNEAGRLAARTKDADSLKGIWRRRNVAQGIEEIKPQLDQLEIACEAFTPKILRWIRSIKSFDSLESEPDFEAAEKAFKGIAYELAGPD